MDTLDKYYDAAWSRIATSFSPQEEERIRETLSIIPQDIYSILDVGCGDGRITNRLISQYGRVVGLESSREALRYVKTEKILGSIDFLPFPDRSFDLVLCCEILEHLLFKVYPKALEEIERVSTKYIIVTVPNNENLTMSLVTCPYCGCFFNPSRHVRSFKSETLEKLFAQFSLQILKSCLMSKVYSILLVRVARLLKLIPSTTFSVTALCPQCGYSPLLLLGDEGSSKTSAINRNRLLVYLLRLVARQLVPTKKRGAWLMALYRRK